MSSMLGKTDSDVTTLSPSSSVRSPRPAAYYVQSPSREDSSHDGENKTNNSFQSSPVLSPMGSPPHSSSSVGHRSSSTRFSGSLKPVNSLKIAPDDAAGDRKGRRGKTWKEFTAIEEEGHLLDEYDDAQSGIPRRCYFPVFVVGFLALFFLFSVILWGASRSQKPFVTVKSIKFDQFSIQAGTDYSGVATDMVSMNSTVKLTLKNTATFFGVHVTSSPLDLTFSRLTLATGIMNKFYQRRKSQRMVMVTVRGKNVPIYGGGASVSRSGGAAAATVPLKLRFVVRCRAYVLGKLVKPEFYKRVECEVDMDPKKMNKTIYLRNSCTYK